MLISCSVKALFFGLAAILGFISAFPCFKFKKLEI